MYKFLLVQVLIGMRNPRGLESGRRASGGVKASRVKAWATNKTDGTLRARKVKATDIQ